MTTNKLSVYITPEFAEADRGDGGIRRVVEAQVKYLPKYGIEIAKTWDAADLVAMHAGAYIDTVNKPTVAHVHGLYWDDYEWPGWCYHANDLVLKSIKHASTITAPTEWVQNAIQRGTWRPSSVIPHGIEPDEWHRRPTEWYVLWNKTRVDPVCDPKPLLELADLASKSSDIQFTSTFTGSGQHGNIQDIGIQTYEGMHDVVEKAGVYLVTSRETFGIGTLEAMAAGVPILGFDWAGQAEFVKHKVHGYLAKPGDINDLYNGLRFCIEHREELSQACYEYTRANFTWDAQVAKYAELYERTVREYATNMARPRVSVVVPCYNLGKYLPECIDSILAQDESGFTDYEVLIIDDASPDEDTRDTCIEQANRDSRITLVRNENNLYLAGTLNKGITLSNGKYILPLDADNMIARNCLKVLSSRLDSDDECDIAYGAMRLITEDGELDTQYGEGGVSDWPGKFSLMQQLLHRNQLPSTSMYRREVWEVSAGYRTRCKTAEDAEFWTRVTSLGFKAEKVTDTVTLVYRNRNDSMSRTNKDWDWTAWFPWSREAAYKPSILDPTNVHTYDPIQVSVVIPVGPGHTTAVMDAIDSVIAQTFQKWEIIVVNDSGQKLPTLPCFVRVLSTAKPASGPAVARNIGIAASKAPHFLLLDADDYIQPEYLAKVVTVQRSTGLYVYTDWVVNENLEHHLSNDYDPVAGMKQMLHSVTALYPKAGWLATGGFDEHLDAWEDWDFLNALAAKGFCGIRLAEPLFYYRMSAGHRREELYARQEEIKGNIYNKWHEYIDGGKQPMCGCSQTVNNVTPPMARQVLEQSASVEGMELLEFTLKEKPVLRYNGKATGTVYNFGSAEDYRLGYVHAADIDGMLSIQGFKRVYQRELVGV